MVKMTKTKNVVVTFKERKSNGRFGKAQTMKFEQFIKAIDFKYGVENSPSWRDKFFDTKYKKEIREIHLKNKGVSDCIEFVKNFVQELLE